MLKKLSVKNFNGVAHLESTALMQNHGGSLSFSLEKPNVIVGPNGAGKTALMTALTLRFLCYETPQSAFSRAYCYDLEDCWTQHKRWYDEYHYLVGLDCETDNAPALFFRPGHLPGNERCITTAMMTGFMPEAKAYREAVRHRSSGQGVQALQTRLMDALEGKNLPKTYEFINWRGKETPVDLRKTQQFIGSYDWKAEVLKSIFLNSTEQPQLPLLLMDEPEQSLDALAEAKLWAKIAAADCSRAQIIVATHSLYPLLHPERFNLIEAVPGYAEETRALFKN